LRKNSDRKLAAALAGHLGDEIGARNALRDADPGVRATALGALARLGRLSADDLAAGVADPDAAVRRRAAELVPELEDAPPLLVPLLTDPDSSVVEVAAFALGERRPTEPGAVDALARLTRDHEDSLCREAAVAALGAIGDPAGLEAVLAALDDRATVRRRATIALAPFEGPEVDAALRRSAEDRDWQVRQAAEDLLGR
jgi:HEAT repeat protein